ncbi:MAG: HD domain-containing protein [Bacillota bacterium]
MINRLRQFYRAYTATMSGADFEFTQAWLSEKELSVFFRMSIIDQKHCVNVARTAEKLSIGMNIDKKLLMRAALLHDCGRKKGDLGIIGKSYAVLFDKFLGYKFFLKLNFASRYKALHNAYRLIEVYYRHPERSADNLRRINCSPAIVQIVLSHHKSAATNDCQELILLRRADALN